MKLVIHTQYCENYGAHDWDGVGECPQYWKFKGGSTYVVEMSTWQLRDPHFLDQVHQCVSEHSDYARQYVLSETVVDTIDYAEADHREAWDTVIYADLIDGALECEQDQLAFTQDPADRRVHSVRTWRQAPGCELKSVQCAELV